MMNQLLLLCLSLVLFFQFQCNPTLGQSIAPSGPTNITKILEKAGQFTVFLRLLGSTQMGDRINIQLNNSNGGQGVTVFAPTDNAFSSLKAGTLNSLTDQQKSELVQFHVIPTFLSTSQFQTVSNPLTTQAGNSNPGQFPLNVTTSAGNQVNISTGVVNASVANTIFTDNQQLAVYQVDKVLLPMNIFASPVSAPAPAPSTPEKKKKSQAAAAPTSDDDDASAAAALTINGVVVAVIASSFLSCRTTSIR